MAYPNPMLGDIPKCFVIKMTAKDVKEKKRWVNLFCVLVQSATSPPSNLLKFGLQGILAEKDKISNMSTIGRTVFAL